MTEKEIPEAATQLFSSLFRSTATRFGEVLTFYQTAKIGAQMGESELYRLELANAKWLFEEPSNDKLFLDKAVALAAEGGIEGFAKGRHQTSNGRSRRRS